MLNDSIICSSDSPLIGENECIPAQFIKPSYLEPLKIFFITTLDFFKFEKSAIIFLCFLFLERLLKVFDNSLLFDPSIVKVAPELSK